MKPSTEELAQARIALEDAGVPDRRGRFRLNRALYGFDEDASTLAEAFALWQNNAFTSVIDVNHYEWTSDEGAHDGLTAEERALFE